MGAVVYAEVITPYWHAGDLGSIPGLGMLYFRCKNLALHIRDCVSLCLSDETLKAVCPFYPVSMPGEVKDHTARHTHRPGCMCNLSWTPHSSLENGNSLNPKMGCLECI